MNLELSRAVKNLSFSLQTSKLASPSFMDAGRRHETPGSEAKEFITHKTTGGMSFIVVTGLHVPQVPQRQEKQAWLTLHSSWAGVTAEEPQAWETPIFHGALQANLSILCSRGRYYLYNTRQQTNQHPLSWETLALSSKAVCCSNITEKIIQNKKLPVPLLTQG